MLFRIIDRYILWTFFRSYLICFASLVGLYIVIDAISNLDEFAAAADHFGDMLSGMATYYTYRLSLFFDMLSGIIALVAAMFTITWMKRHNEIIPFLSCGVSAYRVIFPVVLAAVIVNLAALANQEFIIPRIREHLQRSAGDPHGHGLVRTRPVKDRRGVQFNSHARAHPAEQMIDTLLVVFPVEGMPTIQAGAAYWVDDGRRRGWLLTDLLGNSDYPPDNVPSYVHRLGRRLCFVPTDETASFEQMTRDESWYQYLSTAELWALLPRRDLAGNQILRVQFHTRITKPLMNIILVFLGLPFVLNRYDSSVFLNLGICVLLVAAFFLTMMLSQSLGQSGAIRPSLAAWLPVMGFFVIAIGVFDTIKT